LPFDRLAFGRFGDWPAAEQRSPSPVGREAGEGQVDATAASGDASGATSGSGEEVVVRRRADGSVEVHCHGGRAAVAWIEYLLISGGCVRAAWQTWAAGFNDPIATDALQALALARTERTAAILLDQHHGVLHRALDEIQTAIDQGRKADARRQIDALLTRASLGRHLVRPWRVVLGGTVNVGKSSLINALVGYDRSIVHASPGTTRDAVTVTTAIDGWPVCLCDTAGLHAGNDPVELAGIELARQRLAEADLVILVFDHSAPWSHDDQALRDQWPEAIVVFNKGDLPAASGARPAGLVTTALHGQGLAELLAAVSRRLVPDPPPPGSAVPFADEQVEMLQSLLRALGKRDGE
jgi:tRNA modification GTPase